MRHVPLGRADYGPTLELQRRLHAERVGGGIGDLVITVEHEPVFTLGRSGGRDHLLVSSEVLQREGIAVYKVERGGGITYHGPGQLVAYPIIDLREHGRSVKTFVERLEETVIRVLRRFGVVGEQKPGYPGVWVNGRKVASIGIYVKNWVTRHGLALNVAANPAHFAMIRPCGLPVEAVSIRDLREASVPMEIVREALLAEMGSVFDWTFEEADPEEVGEMR